MFINEKLDYKLSFLQPIKARNADGIPGWTAAIPATPLGGIEEPGFHPTAGQPPAPGYIGRASPPTANGLSSTPSAAAADVAAANPSATAAADADAAAAADDRVPATNGMPAAPAAAVSPDTDSTQSVQAVDVELSVEAVPLEGLTPGVDSAAVPLEGNEPEGSEAEGSERGGRELKRRSGASSGGSGHAGAAMEASEARVLRNEVQDGMLTEERLAMVEMSQHLG